MPRVAILIDGGYFLKRIPTVRPQVNATDPADVVKSVNQLVGNHLNYINNTYNYPNPFRLLHRIFYYDGRPYDKKGHTAVTTSPIDYAKSPSAKFRNDFFNLLRGTSNVSLRLGDVRKDGNRSWILKAQPQKGLLRGYLTVNELTDDHFSPALRHLHLCRLAWSCVGAGAWCRQPTRRVTTA